MYSLVSTRGSRQREHGIKYTQTVTIAKSNPNFALLAHRKSRNPEVDP